MRYDRELQRADLPFALRRIFIATMACGKAVKVEGSRRAGGADWGLWDE
jgi:hypothetical protein